MDEIIKSGNHYLIKVKGNQPKLKSAIEAVLSKGHPTGSYRTQEQIRGRLEIRKTSLFERDADFPEGWESINTLVRVHRCFTSKGGKHETDSLYATDLKTSDAAYIAQGVRSHWFIENKLHYTKDVIMKEDARSTQNKNAASNLALFRDFAFNLLKSKNRSIKYATELFANYHIKEIIFFLLRT